MAGYSILLYVLPILLVARYCWKRRRLYAFARNLAGPSPALPLIGNAWLLLVWMLQHDKGGIFDRIHEYYAKYREQGVRVARFWVGPHLLVLLADPARISTVLNHNLMKAKQYNLFDEAIQPGIFITSNIQKWRTSRKLIGPVFHFSILKTYLRIFYSEASILADKWQQLATSGASFNPEEDINLATFDMVMMSTMGINPRAQKNTFHPFLYHIDKSFEITITRIFNPLLYSNLVCSLIGMRARHKAHAKFQVDFAQDTLNRIRTKQERLKKKMVDEGSMIKNKKELSANHNPSDDVIVDDSVKSFAELMMEHPSYDRSDDVELISQIITVIGAGQDTTKTVNMVALLMLALHPDIQEKVHEEVDRILGKDTSVCPTYEDLGRLEYMDWVIKECLRLFPAAPLIGRYIDRDFPMEDMTLPAGITIVVSIYALHRDPAYYSHPHRFDPSRWAPALVAQRPPNCFIPFSTGARNCIGGRYAMLQMKTTLSTLLRHYKILPGEGCRMMQDVRFTMRVTIRMNDTCRIRLQKRE